MGDSSFFNKTEIRTVIEWIQKIIKSKCNGKTIFANEIEVISPYKKQYMTIQEELSNNGFKDITCGSAEAFQGSEKRIIIISTVRMEDDLGFVDNAQVKLGIHLF